MSLNSIKHSNETQSLLKSSQGTPTGPVTIIPPIVSPPFIDKISLTLMLPDDLRQYFYEIMEQAVSYSATFQFAKATPQYKYTRHIAINGTSERVYFQFGAKCSSAADMRFECNPHEMGDSGMNGFYAFCVGFFPEGFDGWKFIMETARVSRIDVAVDVSNLRMDEFLVLPPQGMTSQRFGCDGHLQTYNLGKPKGNQIRLYCKNAEQLAKGFSMGKKVVRVEQTLRNLKLTPINLAKLSNPFAKMTLLEHCAPPPPVGNEARWSMFQDSIQVRGLTPALALLPQARRTKYRKYLAQYQKIEWWSPSTIWKGWPKALQELL
jgi:hypothetical protein